MRLLVPALAAALLFPAAASAHDGELHCAPACDDAVCADGSRAAAEATLTGEAGGATIEATISRIFGGAGNLYQPGDTLQVPAELGFEPGEKVLFIVSGETVGEILGAVRMDGAEVECGKGTTVEELLPLALGSECEAALEDTDFNVGLCDDHSGASGDDADDSGCAAGGSGLGAAGLLLAASALLRRKTR